jgi:hypothetical protein
MRALVADRTGLEPATSAVTGRYSNQLNYRSKTPSYSDGLQIYSNFHIAQVAQEKNYFSGFI